MKSILGKDWLFFIKQKKVCLKNQLRDNTGTSRPNIRLYVLKKMKSIIVFVWKEANAEVKQNLLEMWVQLSPLDIHKPPITVQFTIFTIWLLGHIKLFCHLICLQLYSHSCSLSQVMELPKFSSSSSYLCGVQRGRAAAPCLLTWSWSVGGPSCSAGGGAPANWTLQGDALRWKVCTPSPSGIELFKYNAHLFCFCVCQMGTLVTSPHRTTPLGLEQRRACWKISETR